MLKDGVNEAKRMAYFEIVRDQHKNINEKNI